LNAVKKRYAAYGSLHTISSIKFPKGMLKSIRFASEMGCEPDFCVWTKKQNPRPKPNREGLRTFGGHVHIEDGTPATVKACDLTLGLWSVLHDLDSDRRRLYGKAGAYRLKDYGIEYRVLSNFWCDNEQFIRKVYQLVRHAQSLEKDIDELVTAVGGAARIQGIINNSQIMNARGILKSLGIE
ncbi:MAG: putative amidoligase domain-containing protein, partial [Nitrososphaera sp.]